MRVQEAMAETGLTRKAIYYYESQGLVRPTQEPENGYREYSSSDIERLQLIAALRQLDVPVEEIREALESRGKLLAILERNRERAAERAKKLERMVELLGESIDRFRDGDTPPPEAARHLRFLVHALDLDDRGRFDFMDRQLRRAFPGVFGRCLAAFLAPFLDQPVDTPEKERAWMSFVASLDELPPTVLSAASEQSLAPYLPDNDEELSALERAAHTFWRRVLEPRASARSGEAQGVERLAELIPECNAMGIVETGSLRAIASELLVESAAAFDSVFRNLEALSRRFARSRRVLERMLAGGPG